MPVTTQLFAYGLRQVLGITEESASHLVEVAESSGTAGKIVAMVRRHFTDHSQTLPRALNHANERAWQALAVSLAGDGLLDRVKAFFSGPTPQALQQQVKAFLAHNVARLDTTSEDMRRACLAELQRARMNGLLSALPDTDEVARQAVFYKALANPASLLADARQAAGGVASALPAEYANLARLLRQGAGEGQPPLLVVAFAHFFRREIQTNEELARGLTFDLLQRLAEKQESALSEVGQALESMGGRFDDLLAKVLEQLGRMEAKLDDIRDQQDDIRARSEDLARRHDIQRESGKSRFQITINNEREQGLARALLEEIRKLPPEAQSADLLTLMGDVLRAAGRFKDAQESYTKASTQTGDRAQQAASLHKAYLTALEQRRWEEALQALIEAAALEPQKYAPFPLHQYQPKRILGAGGFGAVFLCQDRYMRAEVVVKGLHNTEMERSLEDAFSEAHVLRHLSREHPSIIAVQHCSYADESQTRPFIVMDYFPGVSLQAYLDDLEEKPLLLADFQPIAWQIAVGMKAAHDKGVFHRDLKPDNVLVRRGEDGWQVRIIDFGLAIRTRVMQVSTSVPLQERTLSGKSAAGTARYASPEQMGEMPRVEVGPYSDVYAFGKLCCYALFRETEPKTRHRKSIPEELAEMLEKCIERRIADRHPSFEPVLGVLRKLDPARRKSEEGERRLRELVRQALERMQGQPTQADTEAARALCKGYGIGTERANAIVREERQRWREQAEQLEREAAEKARREDAEHQRAEQRKREAEARRQEEKRQRREQEEAERQRQQREEAERQRREAELQQRANLGRWKASGEPRRWVEEHQGEWNHQEWLALVDRVKRSEYWPLNPDEMAAALEEIKGAWTRDQRGRLHRGKIGDVMEVPLASELKLKLAWVPPGRSWLGGGGGTPGKEEFTLSKGLWCGVYPVTQAEWQAVMGNSPSHFGGKRRNPVEQVSWDDVQEFVAKLNARLAGGGLTYRQPTEQEWEYICRGGPITQAQSAYHFYFARSKTDLTSAPTNDLSSRQANFKGNYPAGSASKGPYLQGTSEVGLYLPNPLGVYDLHGNVLEWTSSQEGFLREIRGGSWGSNAGRCLASIRDRDEPGNRSSDLGFRLLAVPSERT